MTIPDVDTLVAATDQELDRLFRQASTLPMDALFNSGTHYLPRGTAEHFSSPEFLTASSNVRQVSDDALAGRWETALTGAYARLVVSGAQAVHDALPPQEE